MAKAGQFTPKPAPKDPPPPPLKPRPAEPTEEGRAESLRQIHQASQRDLLSIMDFNEYTEEHDTIPAELRRIKDLDGREIYFRRCRRVNLRADRTNHFHGTNRMMTLPVRRDVHSVFAGLPDYLFDSEGNITEGDLIVTFGFTAARDKNRAAELSQFRRRLSPLKPTAEQEKNPDGDGSALITSGITSATSVGANKKTGAPDTERGLVADGRETMAALKEQSL